MKIEWRKHEKAYYLPKNVPEKILVPSFNFFSIKGTGNPNSAVFGDCIAALYSLSYAVKMSYKWDAPPEMYSEYTVYPLEGVWDIADKSKYVEGFLNKDNLVFELMIRQPDFVTAEFAKHILNITKQKKPNPLLDFIDFKSVEDGLCIQMLHLGSYDDEPTSFERMEQYAVENNLKRVSKIHREIYLSDPRKTVEEKLKTVLRFKTTKK